MTAAWSLASTHGALIQFGTAAPIALIEGPQMFIRAVQIGPLGFAVGKGQNDGHAYLICEDHRAALNLGFTYGNLCVALITNGFTLYATIQTGLASYTIFAVNPTTWMIIGEKGGTLPLSAPQGFLGAHADATPILQDPTVTTLLGEPARFPCTVGTTTVAQGGNGGMLVSDGVTVGTLFPGTCYEPHLSANGLWAVCRSDGWVFVGAVPSVIPPLAGPAPEPVPPTPMPIPPTPEPPIPPVPVVRVPFPYAGHTLMPQIQGLIQYYGTNPADGKKVTLTADPTTGEVWSVQPDGSLQKRPKGTAGGYEMGILDGQVWSVQPSAIYSFVVALVAGL